MGCFVCVPESKVYIVENCGKFHSTAEPGFHCIGIPPFCRAAGAVNLRVQQINVKCQTKTKDNVFVEAAVVVQYEVIKEKVNEAYYKLQNPIQQINSFVFDIVRSEIPKLLLDEVFESKDDIANAIRDSLDKEMHAFGFVIRDTLVTDIDPDAKVKSAMNEINANRRLRIAASEKAEAEKFVMVKKSEAESESKYLQGYGIARQRRAIVDGLKDSVAAFQSEVGAEIPAKQILDLVMVTQYFDTLKDLAHGTSTKAVFFQYDEGPLAALSDEIRNGVMQGNLKIGKDAPAQQVAR